MNKLIFYTILIFTVLSCEVETEPEIKYFNEKLLVNSISISGKPVFLSLWKTEPYGNAYKYCDAMDFQDTEILLKEENTVVEKIQNLTTNYFMSDFVTAPGKTYSLEIHSPMYGDISASTFIPVLPQIISIDTTSMQDDNFPDQKKYNLKIVDDASVKNYYWCYMAYTPYTEDSIYHPAEIAQNGFGVRINDDFIDGYSPHNGNFGCFFDDSHINGDTATISVLYSKYDGDYYEDIHLYFCTVSEELFLYAKQIHLQDWQSFDIFEEPILSYSNINNGFGLFAGMSVFVDSTRVTK